jgi:hypothetical protein
MGIGEQVRLHTFCLHRLAWPGFPTTRAVATFTEMGYDVTVPITESANSYDWLYVFRPDGREYLYKECHAGRRSVTPTPRHLIGGVAESG